MDGWISLAAGLIGALIGAAAALAGSVIAARDTKQARVHNALKAARDERMAAYAQLLTAARKLRYLARGESVGGWTAEDIKTELSTAQYVIEMLAPKQMVALGEAVRADTLEYAGAKDKGKDEAERARLREVARAAVDAFTAGARDDLNLSS
ncbi:hypothetical protein [Agromyces bauzanensis]